MPQAFNVVSQDEETNGLGLSTAELRDGNRCRYVHISPKVQTFIAGTAVLLSLTLIIAHISTRTSGKEAWPPPGVNPDLYAEDIYDSKKAAQFMFKLEPNKSYKQFTKMTTTSEYDFGSEDFVESLHMMIDGKLDVEEWVEHGKHEGYSIGITFDQVAVETEDSSGDSTYYNSLAENGDSDFDEVLETMVGEKVYVEVNDEYDLVDEEDSENTLEELEQEYSYGTTTGLSAIDQVIQLTNLMSFLPSDPSKDYFPGDSWEFSMETDIYFEGRSTFEGYLNYNGIECAVINSVAKIDDDKENTIGDDGWDIEEIEIENGTIEATFYWDVKNNIPRFALTKIVMTTEVQSVIDEDGEGSTSLDETDDNNIELPMTEVLEMYVAPV